MTRPVNVKNPATLTLTKPQMEVMDWLRALPRARSVVVSTELYVMTNGMIHRPRIRITGGVNEGEGTTCKSCKSTKYDEPYVHVVFEWDHRGFSHAELSTANIRRNRNKITSIREAKARVLSAAQPKKKNEGPF